VSAEEAFSRLTRRDSVHLLIVIILILLLTFALCSFAVAGHQFGQRWDSQQTAIYGLLILVVIFSFFALHRQSVINRLRTQLASQLKMTAAFQMRAEMLQNLAILDPLTGLVNRRFAMDRLRSEVSRAERHNTKLTIMSIDLNGLKLINDKHGHAAGDKVLQEFSNALRRAVRNSDIASRIGEDEFLLILPECDPADLPAVLGRLSNRSVEHQGSSIEILFSAGWAEYVPGEGTEELLERADRELYEDKRTGGAGELASAARSQFLQKEQLTSMGRLTTSVARDFNNLLTIIKGYTEIILAEPHSYSEMLPKVQQINKAADRAISLTGQLLAFTRKQAMDRKVVRLNRILAGTEMMLRRLAGTQVNLAIQYGTELDHVYVDAGQMEQMIMTLAAGANSAMPQGGNLFFETSSFDMDAEFCKWHPGARKGAYVRLTTRDSGMGLDTEELTRILDPFINVTERLKDRGLGLTIVYGIIKQNGGYISLESAPATGTSVSTFIPLALDRAITKTEATCADARAASGPGTILVVDGYNSLQDLMCEFLGNEGCRILCAGSAEDGMRIAAEHAGTIQLLVTDLILPGMSGIELSDCITSESPGIGTLFVSGCAEDAAFCDIGHRSHSDFIAAPFTADEFLEKVRSLLLSKSADQVGY
jgi:diguanylate cyclase (GGDEF)-like protein